MLIKRPMSMSISSHGVSVLYSCYNLLNGYGKRCKEREYEKCVHCRYCKAEMSADDATKLLRNQKPSVKIKQKEVPSNAG